MKQKWPWHIFGVLLLAVTVLSFQNCSNGFQTVSLDTDSLNSKDSLVDSGNPDSGAGGSSGGTNVSPLQSLKNISIVKDGQGICNSVSFTQIPNNRDYFLGRVLNESAPGKCDSNTWSLGLFKMDWARNTLTFQKYMLRPDILESSGKKVASTYDPHVAEFNGELWVAFECTGDFGVGASSCVAPFTVAGGVNTARMTLIVEGAWVNNRTEAYSASVPKLLVYKGGLYLYWTTCHFVMNNGSLVLVEVTSRGTKLMQESSGLKRLWTQAVIGSPMSAFDTANSSEVWGGTTNDATANSMADIFDFYVQDDTIYAVAAVGPLGCVTPLSPLLGCYRARIASSTIPLGHHIFNSNFLKAPALPGNPMEYTRVFKNPSGGNFMMGQFLNPVLNGSAPPANMIQAGFVRYDIELKNHSMLATGNSDGVMPSPVQDVAVLGATFSILQIYHRGCVSTAATDIACNAAAARYCQSQGYTSASGILQHKDDNMTVMCATPKAATVLVATTAQLRAVNNGCTDVTVPNGFCQSAIYHYCRQQGYAGGGLGPQEVSSGNVMISCLSSSHSKQVAVTFQALSGYHSACTGSDVAATDGCRAAADLACRDNGAAAGYGLVDYNGGDAVAGCIY